MKKNSKMYSLPKRLLSGLLSMLFGLSSLSTHANLLEEIAGVGARTKAMGDAGIAESKDYSAVYYNPANLSFCKSTLVTLGYEAIGTNLFVDSETPLPNPIQLGVRHLMDFGICMPMPLNFSMGAYVNVGLTSPLDLGVRTLDNSPDFVLYGVALASPSLLGGIAYQPIKYVSIGASISIQVDTNMQQFMEIPVGDSKKIQTVQINGSVTPAARLIAGVTVEPIDELKIGVVFRSPMFVRFSTVADINIDATVPLNVKNAIENISGYSPLQLGLGASYQIIKPLTLTADLTWQRWSNMPNPFLRISILDNPALASLSAGNTTEDGNLNFEDTFIPRVGIEYFIFPSWAVRGGYSFRYSPAPIPEPSQTSRLLDSHAHIISLGSLYTMSFKTFAVDLEAFGKLGLLHTRSAALSSSSTYDFGGAFWNTGASCTWRY